MSVGTLSTWAAEKGWEERCAAYDAYRIAQREQIRARLEREADLKWEEERAQLYALWGTLAREALERMVADMRKRGHVMRPNELARIIETYTRQRNALNGDVTERVEMPFDLSNASAEQLASLEGLRALQKDSKDDD